MDCKVAKRLIPAFMDAELGPDKAAALSEHISSCHSCRQEMASLERTMEAIGVCAELEPSFTLADIRQRAAQRQLGNPMLSWLQRVPSLATAAMVLAAIAVGSVSGIYYGSHRAVPIQSHHAASSQRVSGSFNLDAFDDGLAGAVYVADARTKPAAEVTR